MPGDMLTGAVCVREKPSQARGRPHREPRELWARVRERLSGGRQAPPEFCGLGRDPGVLEPSRGSYSVHLLHWTQPRAALGLRKHLFLDVYFGV